MCACACDFTTFAKSVFIVWVVANHKHLWTFQIISVTGGVDRCTDGVRRGTRGLGAFSAADPVSRALGKEADIYTRRGPTLARAYV